MWVVWHAFRPSNFCGFSFWTPFFTNDMRKITRCILMALSPSPVPLMSTLASRSIQLWGFFFVWVGPAGVWSTYQSHTAEEDLFFPSQELSDGSGSLVDGGFSPLRLLYAQILSRWSWCQSLACHAIWVYTFSCPAVSEKHSVLELTSHLWSLSPLLPPFLEGRGVV